jgi:hypothetical protein
MSTALTIECAVHFQREARGRKELRSGVEAPPLPPGRVPRVARLMALALPCDALVRSGQISNYSELASLGQVTRAWVSQILSLVCLPPDIQETLLFLPPTERGRDPIILADLLPIAATFDWRKQRRRWRQLLSSYLTSAHPASDS